MAAKLTFSFRSLKRRFLRSGLAWGLVFSLSLVGVTHFPVTAQIPENVIVSQAQDPQTLLQQGRQFYQGGQYAKAVEVWRVAATQFNRQGDISGQILTFNLLSLAHQQLGEWEAAKNALNNSFAQLPSISSAALAAQTYNTQGHLQFLQGQPEAALETWKEAATLYQQAGDTAGKVGAFLNQAQAMQALGLYTREIRLLAQLQDTLEHSSDTTLQMNSLRAMGEAFRRLGELERSKKVLQQSLALAQAQPLNEATAESLLSLGNTARSAQDLNTALNYYQQVATLTTSPLTKIQAQLNALSLLLEQRRFPSATELANSVQQEIMQLPLSQKAIYAQINFAESLAQLVSSRPQNNAQWQEIATLLANAVTRSQQLNDDRASAYALGRLGGIYEQQRQFIEAEKLTRQALNQAQVLNAPDIAYRWQWQLGRILNAQAQQGGTKAPSLTEASIAAYTEAVNSLQSLRTDLVSINSDVQFSFRESVEPVYRELISLLLSSPSSSMAASKQNSLSDSVSEDNLVQALNILESLQLAELDNFFGDACSDVASGYGNVAIEQVDNHAAVIYPIILEDRLEILLSVPGQPLQRYVTSVPRGRIDATIAQLRQALVTPRFSTNFIQQNILPLSQQVYDWLIRPLEADLASDEVHTLVFVLDGSLRNIPMSVLYDGEQYLLEKYTLALSPSRQIPNPQPLASKELTVLAAGLSEARQGFVALPGVKEELQQIQSELPAVIFLNEEFTTQTVEKELESANFPIIHLATHGLFSSTASETFIITWDGRINVNDLETLLKARTRLGYDPIELLVFSACETAQGDDRASLGIAGVAIRAGAQSTLATLWAVSDEATMAVMTRFYQELTQNSGSKVEALRNAQLKLLRDTQYQHPLFWSPYVLVGNWL